jgi:hypothetical protein
MRENSVCYVDELQQFPVHVINWILDVKTVHLVGLDGQEDSHNFHAQIQNTRMCTVNQPNAK